MGQVLTDSSKPAPKPAMRFNIFEDAEALSRRAADIMSDAVANSPGMLLCAASGGSPTRAYDLFAAEKARGARLRIMKLDEWAGMGAEHEASCEAYLRRHLTDPLAIPDARYLAFDGLAADGAAECARVERRLEAEGPIDLLVLGVGVNGHLGLNEPAEALTPGCHVAALAETSQAHPMLAGNTAPPRHGLTLGMAGILQAKRILTLVSGSHKRDAMQRFLTRQITPAFPASFLWLHGNVDFLADADAMAGLEAPA